MASILLRSHVVVPSRWTEAQCDFLRFSFPPPPPPVPPLPENDPEYLDSELRFAHDTLYDTHPPTRRYVICTIKEIGEEYTTNSPEV